MAAAYCAYGIVPIVSRHSHTDLQGRAGSAYYVYHIYKSPALQLCTRDCTPTGITQKSVISIQGKKTKINAHSLQKLAGYIQLQELRVMVFWHGMYLHGTHTQVTVIGIPRQRQETLSEVQYFLLASF